MTYPLAYPPVDEGSEVENLAKRRNYGNNNRNQNTNVNQNTNINRNSNLNSNRGGGGRRGGLRTGPPEAELEEQAALDKRALVRTYTVAGAPYRYRANALLYPPEDEQAHEDQNEQEGEDTEGTDQEEQQSDENLKKRALVRTLSYTPGVRTFRTWSAPGVRTFGTAGLRSYRTWSFPPEGAEEQQLPDDGAEEQQLAQDGSEEQQLPEDGAEQEEQGEANLDKRALVRMLSFTPGVRTFRTYSTPGVRTFRASHIRTFTTSRFPPEGAEEQLPEGEEQQEIEGEDKDFEKRGLVRTFSTKTYSYGVPAWRSGIRRLSIPPNSEEETAAQNLMKRDDSGNYEYIIVPGADQQAEENLEKRQSDQGRDRDHCDTGRGSGRNRVPVVEEDESRNQSTHGSRQVVDEVSEQLK
ncbi:hypothetical protein L211DRAFT_843939 [Terfezia boudieri ATCC MYA-4762]|uniref:Uncharacterized protein n=1 Tax=Terfezia boudieri ATCC MYA-4762 TaxID=1051890 RepID=A0A3N4L5L1_9PEZI|nr:hypothetical protein L211DRAFT_843939 [Terfezia boudieri ATCC MYA-4762]